MLKRKVPVNVITGYLGAGKTTLLKKLLEGANERIAVVMNEFGEIGVDTKTIRGKNVEMKELLGGCVCCSLTGDFLEAMREIIEDVRPDRIVVETTGVAEPDAMIVNIREVEGVFLDSVICVVDADAMVRFPSIGHTGRVQIESADIIIINKSELVDVGKLEEIKNMVSNLNPSASLKVATYCNVDLASLFGLGSSKEVERHGEHNTDIIDSFVYRSERVHDRPKFIRFISQIPEKIVRAKGHVIFADGVYLFNLVNGRYSLEKDGEGPTELVFIGEGVNEFERQVIESLRECEV
jgi:G3E family GTPase